MTKLDLSESNDKNMPVTLLDVAREAGVSPSTVSRILNGTAQVTPKKREAVEQAIRELNFKPNLFARSLKTGITMTVGVLTQTIDSKYYGRALRGIEQGLQSTGHFPIFVSGHWNAELERNALDVLIDRRVDGLIILTGDIHNDTVIELAQHQPIVITERELNAPQVHSTFLDQYAAGKLATEHLLQLGHRHIAHLQGILGRPDSIERLRGFTDAMTQAGVTVNPQLVEQGQFTEQGGYEGTLRLLQTGVPFTAIFCANDDCALGANLALYRHGLKVPQDVSLVGFDDLPSLSYMTPPLTTIHQPIFEVGLYAAQSLQRMMGYTSEPSPIPPLHLVVRQTTQPPRSL